MEFFIRFFNQSNINDNLKLNVGENCIRKGLYHGIVESLEKNLHLQQGEFTLLSKNGIKIDVKSSIQDGQIIQICPTVLGGKVYFF